MSVSITNIIDHMCNIIGEEHQTISNEEMSMLVEGILKQWKHIRYEYNLDINDINLIVDIIDNLQYFDKIYEMLCNIDDTEYYNRLRENMARMMLISHPIFLGGSYNDISIEKKKLFEMFHRPHIQITYSIASMFWSLMFPEI